MKQINLYQAEFRPLKVLLPARLLLLSGGVFLAGLLAFSALQNLKLKQKKGEVAQIVQRAEALEKQAQASGAGPNQADPAVITETQNLETRVRALQLAQDAIAGGELGSEAGYSAQFLALSRAVGSLPGRGAWLTGVTVSDRGRGLDLDGRALTGADAARLIASLRREPLFVGLSFASLNVHTPDADSADKSQTQAQMQMQMQMQMQTHKAAKYLEFSLHARPLDPVLVGQPQTVSTVKAGA